MFFSSSDYGSHYVALAAAICRCTSSSPVLELGCGDGSTLLLHEMCRGVRTLVSADTDESWLNRFSFLRRPWHKFHLVQDWSSFSEIEQHDWSVALVDHAPGERRVEEIARLRDRCEFVVVHDTEKDLGVGTDYGYEPVFDTFKYITEYRLFRPYTVVVSQVRKLELDCLAPDLPASTEGESA